MKRSGITLVELLVAMAVLGIFLAMLGSFFSSNNRIANRQIDNADTNVTLRQSLLRISEVVSQAAYIYPANQTLTLTGSPTLTRTTGAHVIAVLVAGGNNSNYCAAPVGRYCGFIYSIENRSTYASILVGSSPTNFALIEGQSVNLTWNQNTLPTKNWSGVSYAVVADHVVPSSESNGSSMGAVSNLGISQETPSYDDQSGLFSINATAVGQANGLVATISPRLVIASKDGNTKAGRAAHIFSRAIPRAGLPTD